MHGRTASAAFDANDPLRSLDGSQSRSAAVSCHIEVCHPFVASALDAGLVLLARVRSQDESPGPAPRGTAGAFVSGPLQITLPTE